MFDELRELPRQLPPHNVEAEQALLGALLVNNGAYDRVGEFLLPEHFADAIHGRIYAAVSKLVERGQVANPVTLKHLFDQDGALAEIGGAAYLARLAVSVVTIVNAEDYGRTIYDLWLRREIIRVAQDAEAMAHSPNLDLSGAALLSEVEAKLYAISEAEDGALLPIADTIDSTIARVENAWRNRGTLLGTTTGLVDLDRILGGLMGGELYVLAGRPGMGKTSCAKTIALAAARAGHPVSFFSLEMPKELLTMWFLADMTGISADRQRRGDVEENDISQLVEAGGILRRLPIHIDETPALSIMQIRARARRLKRRNGLGAIIIDHLGLMAASKAAEQRGETAAISEITKQLKELAKDLGVPVVALCQLNRGVEGREDKRPTLADLRQSGSIEEDADVVIMCYRAEYYLRKSEPVQKVGEDAEKFSKHHAEWSEALERAHGLAELILAKHRSGPEATVRVTFEPEHSRMANLAPSHFSADSCSVSTPTYSAMRG